VAQALLLGAALAPALPFALPAQRALPTPEQQIAAAVLPLPQELRNDATVMGYRVADKLEILREGKNGMTCLALFAVEPNFHAACYHRGMEPFMARGRELRAQGVTGAQVDSVRFREVKAGKLEMPRQAAMYQLFGGKTSWDAATGKVTDARSLLVVYMPGATTESSGLSPVPAKTGPWIMDPGTPKAHIMLTGSMNP
jgi:hypothetical protein